MKRINFTYVFLFIMLALLTTLTACGCGGNKAATYSDTESELRAIQLTAVSSTLDEELTAVFVATEKQAEIKANLNSSFNGSNVEEVIDAALASAKEEIEAGGKNVEEVKTIILNKQLESVKNAAINKLSTFYEKDSLKKRVNNELCNQEFDNTYDALVAATNASTDIDKENVVEGSTNVYQIFSNYVLNINTKKTQLSPIRIFSFKSRAKGGDGFFPALFNDALVFPIGWLLVTISRGFGGYYIVGLLIVTILIRTAMMPVYNSTSNMQLKQNLMQPELQKLEAKYANRQDPDSQKAKQMEQMQLYRKYKVGFGGCFALLLQFPIFIGVYQAVQRMHLTDGTILNSPNWTQHLNTKFCGIDLFLNRGEAWKAQFWGVMVILVLVVGTQIAQQILTKVIQKATYRNSQADIPEYKRQAMQQDQSQNSMKFMMYFMIAMMGIFVFQSAAGLGIYWLIGNIYSLVQMFINYKLSDKKLERLKKKLNVGDR